MGLRIVKSGKTSHTNASIATKIGWTQRMTKHSDLKKDLRKLRSVAKIAVGQRKCAWRAGIQPKRAKEKERRATKSSKSLLAACLSQQPRKFFAKILQNAVRS